MSDLTESSEIMQELSAPTVPTLFQLALSWISNLSLWSFAQDIPETAVPGLLKKIKLTDFDLDLLPNLLPASLQHLDLSGYIQLTEDTLLVIIKKCFCISELILNDVPLITQQVVPQIFWHLPDLTYLSLGAGVGSLSMLEIVQKPIKLVHLEINSASMDEMWLEQLRYFPDLIALKLRNVALPKIQSVPFKLPPNLASVNISTAKNQILTAEHVKLFEFFLMHAPNLQEFICKYRHREHTVQEIGPIAAKNLRVLRTDMSVKVSKFVLDAINDTCQKLEEVSGLSRIIEDDKSELIGERSLAAGAIAKIHFIFTNKKLNYDFTEITSGDGAWKEGPMSFYAPTLAVYTLPIDPCLTLRTLILQSGTVDVVELLQLFPNLEHLDLSGATLKMDKKQQDDTQILGYHLKSLKLVPMQMPVGAMDLLTRSKSLKKVSLEINRIPEFKLETLHFDKLLEKFPFAEELKIEVVTDATTITNQNEDASDLGSNTNFSDHPVRKLSFIRRPVVIVNALPNNLTLRRIDLGRYKNLQALKLQEVYLGVDVKLPTRLRVLEVEDIHGLYKESFNIPLTLYHLQWKSNMMFSEILAAMHNMKHLRSVQFMGHLQERAEQLFGDQIQMIYGSQHKWSLKYLLPRRSELTKTNLLSAFSGIRKEMSPMEKLPALLKSSGSNLSMKDVQLIAEMYSKQEISLRSDQPVVRVKIRLTSGAVMNINCNPTHRVIDLYAYARHAVKLGDKAFDLVVPPKTILDLSTYDKTVQELRLTNTTLIQKLREATPVENELRSFGLFHSALINFGKNKDAGLSNSQDQSIKKSNYHTTNSNNNMTSRNDDNYGSDESEESYDSEAENEDQDQISEDEDESDSMQISDDDDDLDMFYAPEKVENKVEITGENKYLLDQMNAEAMRKSMEYHAQKQRNEQKLQEEQEMRRREEAKRKNEAEQKRIADQARTIWRNVPLHGANPVNNMEFMTDEEMARMLQEEEYLNNFDG